MNCEFFKIIPINRYISYVIKSVKYRIYPSAEQSIVLAQWFGSARFVYNKALDHKINTYNSTSKSLSYNDLATGLLKTLKSQNDWLRFPPSQSLQQSLKNLDSAYKNFFKRNNKGFPKFKSKFAKQTLKIPQTNNHIKIDWKNNKIVLPKLGKVFSPLHRKFSGTINNITISKSKTNKYFASICYETGSPVPNKLESINNIIGIDLGIKDFLTLSNGEKILNNKFYNSSLKNLRILQRRLSNKVKGSSNYKKMKFRVAKLHEYIANCRNDYYHKLSRILINENQVIFVEDLNVKGLQQSSNKVMNRHISDVSWSTFVQMLTYKAEYYGSYLFKVNPRNTSKMCSKCGEINKDLKLSDRAWQCKHCQTEHDRDVNAAINILKIGQELPEFQALNCSNCVAA